MPDPIAIHCEALVRHLEVCGEELLEKNFIQNDQITCSIFVILGPNTEELTGLVREWCLSKGLLRTK